MRKIVFSMLAIALVLPGAFAVDGVVLINQSTVMAAGGFPYSIMQPGSYRLSGNLTAPPNSNGIAISADNVSLDLNGFTITGTIVDVGIHGLVSVVDIGGSNISISNGSIVLNGSTIMGQGGVGIGDGFRLGSRRVTLRHLLVLTQKDANNTSIRLAFTAAIVQSNEISGPTVLGQFSNVQSNSLQFLDIVSCPSLITGNVFAASIIFFEGPPGTCVQSNNAFQ